MNAAKPGIGSVSALCVILSVLCISAVYGCSAISPQRRMVFDGNAGTDVDDIGSSERATDLANTEGTNGAAHVMAEAGLLDQTIMAQVGHISPEMIKHYSHI